MESQGKHRDLREGEREKEREASKKGGKMFAFCGIYYSDTDS